MFFPLCGGLVASFPTWEVLRRDVHFVRGYPWFLRIGLSFRGSPVSCGRDMLLSVCPFYYQVLAECHRVYVGSVYCFSTLELDTEVEGDFRVIREFHVPECGFRSYNVT